MEVNHLTPQASAMYENYKILHLVGLILLFGGLGIAIQRVASANPADATGRKLAAIAHGVGLFLLLLGGFGMLAKLSIHWPWPGWVMVKVAIWLLLGGSLTLVRRMPHLASLLFFLSVALGGVAAWMAILKPIG